VSSNGRLTLFRGIAVPVEKASHIKDHILREGIRGDEGKQWRFELSDLRQSIDSLLQKPNLVPTDTGAEAGTSQFSVLCACGDEVGASFYATRHNARPNTRETSYVIQFSAQSSGVYIDGRDFLYTCFQLWDQENKSSLEIQRRTLMKIYGSRIARYFDKAAASNDQQYRIAVCDLACQDAQIVESHVQNGITVRGRHGVVFSSAFLVTAPVLPTEIIKVDEAIEMDFRPDLTLDDFLKGRINLNAQ
jgi:hypothetical protein